MPQLLGPLGNGSVRLFRRSVTLDVGRDNAVDQTPAFRIQSGEKLGLTVAFKIEKSDKPEPNNSTIQIYNLSDAHRAQLEVTGIRCFLSAGYPSAESQIFSGNVRFALTEKQGVDWVTKLELGDGLAGLAGARVTQAWRPGTLWKDVVAGVADVMKDFDKGNLIDRVTQVGAGVVMRNGFTCDAPASAVLTELLAQQDLNWSVQDGRIEALAAADYLPGEGPLISEDTGLVGSPTIGAAQHKGGPQIIKVKCLLNPALKPGSRFQLKSASLSCVCRCHKVIQSGNSRSGDWYTESEVTQIR